MNKWINAENTSNEGQEMTEKNSNDVYRVLDNILLWIMIIAICQVITCNGCNSVATAQTLTPCHQWTVRNWCRPAVNFKTWAVISNPTTQCYVYIPTIADANAAAVNWISEVKE